MAFFIGSSSRMAADVLLCFLFLQLFFFFIHFVRAESADGKRGVVFRDAIRVARQEVTTLSLSLSLSLSLCFVGVERRVNVPPSRGSFAYSFAYGSAIGNSLAHPHPQPRFPTSFAYSFACGSGDACASPSRTVHSGRRICDFFFQIKRKTMTRKKRKSRQ